MRSPTRSTTYPHAISVDHHAEAGHGRYQACLARSRPRSRCSAGMRNATPLMNTFAHSVADNAITSIDQRRDGGYGRNGHDAIVAYASHDAELTSHIVRHGCSAACGADRLVWDGHYAEAMRLGRIASPDGVAFVSVDGDPSRGRSARRSPSTRSATRRSRAGPGRWPTSGCWPRSWPARWSAWARTTPPTPRRWAANRARGSGDLPQAEHRDHRPQCADPVARRCRTPYITKASWPS